jgi:hypothetical protein
MSACSLLKERSRSAFKNFAYRGRDLSGVLERFAEALQDGDVDNPIYLVSDIL